MLPCRAPRAFLILIALLTASPRAARAVGLGLGDSYAALRAMRVPLGLTWSIDKATVRMLGGGRHFSDDLMLAVKHRLREAGVDVVDGTFDPLAQPYVCVDLWARGVTRPEDPSDPLRVLDFQFQVFAPAGMLRDARHAGRIEVWQRGIFGVCGRADLRREESVYLGLCEGFARDWRAARGIVLKRRAPAGAKTRKPHPARSQTAGR